MTAINNAKTLPAWVYFLGKNAIAGGPWFSTDGKVPAYSYESKGPID